MPQKPASRIKGLHKHHSRGCTNRVGHRPTACDCPWYGHYKGVQKRPGGVVRPGGRSAQPGPRRGRPEAPQDRDRQRDVQTRTASSDRLGPASGSATSSRNGRRTMRRSTA